MIDADQFAYGGLPYIKSLLTHRADINTMDRHIKQVKDRKVRVNLINGLGTAHSALKNQTADISKTMDSMVSLISEAGTRFDGQFHEAMDSLEEMYVLYVLLHDKLSVPCHASCPHDDVG